MKYLIVNTSTWDGFKTQVDAHLATGHSFNFDFIERMGDANGEFPGGWGCLRFEDALPAEWLFTDPDVEYRYSDENKEWACNGVAALEQIQLRGLYNYFVSLEGRHQ